MISPVGACIRGLNMDSTPLEATLVGDAGGILCEVRTTSAEQSLSACWLIWPAFPEFC